MTTIDKLRALRREVARHHGRAGGNPRCQCDGPRECLLEILERHRELFGRKRS